MILGFKIKFPWGEKTNFKEKILAGVGKTAGAYLIPDGNGSFHDTPILIDGNVMGYIPKIHTIRTDRPNRWKKGRTISMCYRGKNYSILDEFSKGISKLQHCTGVQTFELKTFGNFKIITIDGRQLGLAEHFILAKNDGFEDIHQFYKWFNMVEFKGKIIHWTDFRY